MKRRALITGASAGLGIEFARQLASRGYDLLLVARREERLAAVAAELRAAHGVDVAIFPADMADPATPAALETFVREQGLHIDYLVNKAGSAGPGLLDDTGW